MDKFGYIRGRQGPRGRPGKDAVNLSNWYPTSVLRMFRENEECTFYFNTAEDGILYDKDKKPIGLKDRFGEFRDEATNAICLQNFLKPVNLKGGYYGIPLKNSLYKLSGMTTGITEFSMMMVAFSFKVSAPWSDEDNYIFTDPYGYRGVTISKKSLNILGSEHRLDLDYYAKGEWNTMIIQYSRVTEAGDDQCFFVLNGRKGSFRPRVYDPPEMDDLYIGGHPEKRNFANIVLASFEVYGKVFDPTEPVPNPIQYVVPDDILQVIQTDMEGRTS